HPIFLVSLSIGPTFHPRAPRETRCSRRAALRAHASPPARSPAAATAAEFPRRGLPPRAPAPAGEIAAAPKPAARPSAAPRCSAPPAPNNKLGAPPCRPLGRAFPIFHTISRCLSAFPRSGCTTPPCSRGLPRRGSPDAAPATGYGHY